MVATLVVAACALTANGDEPSAAALAPSCGALSEETPQTVDGPYGSSIPRVDAATTTAAAVRALLTEFGVVVVENAASPAQMDALDADLETNRGRMFRGRPGSFAGADITRNSAKPLAESATARDLAVHPLVLEVAKTHLAPWCKRIRLGACTAMYVDPLNVSDAPSPAQVFHRDDMIWNGDLFWTSDCNAQNNKPTLGISAMWAISDFTALNGATRVAVGSHRQCPRTAQPTPAMRIEQAVMPKGSVLLWDDGTFHGASARATYEELLLASQDDDVDASLLVRKSLFFVYQLGWTMPEHNFFFAMPTPLVRSSTFSAELQGLLGLDGLNAPEVDAHPWTSGPVYTLPYMGGADGQAAGDGVQYEM